MTETKTDHVSPPVTTIRRSEIFSQFATAELGRELIAVVRAADKG